MSSEDNRREWKRYSLGPREELRIEVEDGQTVLVCLLDGTAELFGTELAKDREYSLELAKIAIFTYHGCQLVLDKEPSLAYISADTPMVEYLNVHENLEVLRNRASEEGISGPRVVICGAEECGKNALSSILLNYAVRVGRKPVFVDLDVALNELSCHGSIAASPIYSPKDIEKGFIDVTPTVHFFGYTSIAENVDHYQTSVRSLAASVNKRLSVMMEENASGIIINTSGFSGGSSLDIMRTVIDAFHADVIVIIGHERLAAQLRTIPELKDKHIVKLHKSPGVVIRDSKFRSRLQKRMFKNYFYGPDSELTPRQVVIGFNGIGFYEVGGTPQAPSSTLPIGEDRLLKPTQISPVTPSQEFIYSILAVSYSKSPEELLSAPVSGFVHVISVEPKKRTLTLLSPQPGPLPATCLLHGSIKWFDN